MTDATESAENPAPSTATAAHGLSADQLAEAKQYNRQAFRCDLLDRALDLVFLSAVVWLAAVPLDRWLKSLAWTQYDSVRLLVVFTIVTLIHILVSLPLSFYSGHILEHRYHLSRQTAASWLRRYVKRHALTLIIGGLTTLGLYWIIWLTGSWWWLVAAGGFFVLSVVIGQLAPVLILPIFYRVEPIRDPELSERLSAISAGTGLSIEGVYRMSMSDETVKANAMLAGLGSTRRVILGDTLLDSFSREEIDVIFAHEIGHHVHRHVPQLILAGLLYSMLGFWICDRLLRIWVERFEGQLDYSQFPVHTLPLLMLVMAVFFMFVEPLQNGISRHFERQADRYALQRTGLVEAYRSAFSKLARLNKADPDPHPLELVLFHSHPSISQRLAAADAWQADGQAQAQA